MFAFLSPMPEIRFVPYPVRRRQSSHLPQNSSINASNNRYQRSMTLFIHNLLMRSRADPPLLRTTLQVLSSMSAAPARCLSANVTQTSIGLVSSFPMERLQCFTHQTSLLERTSELATYSVIDMEREGVESTNYGYGKELKLGGLQRMWDIAVKMVEFLWSRASKNTLRGLFPNGLRSY